MISVNFCVIATGRYRALLPGMLESARRFFCVDFSPRFHVWSDEPIRERGLTWHYLAHEPWPGPTLHRYRAYLASASDLRKADYTFHFDADLRFVRPVCDEIFSDLVAVVHPGYEYARPGQLPYETRLESMACVLPRWRRRYWIGAVQGGRTDRWLSVMKELDSWIAIDEQRGIVTPWQDESYWVKYLSVYGQSLELSPDYCWYPDYRATTGRDPIIDRESTARILHMPKDERLLRA